MYFHGGEVPIPTYDILPVDGIEVGSSSHLIIDDLVRSTIL